MSQHSSDVPIVANFSIYIFPGYVHRTGWYHLNYFEGKKLISHRDPLKSEFFEKSQMSESIDVPSGCEVVQPYWRHRRMVTVSHWCHVGQIIEVNF